MMKEQIETVFEISGLLKVFDGKQVLSITDLTFNKGLIYCLYGSNGSGKTTLFDVLTMLEKPTDGKIYFKGRQVYPAGDGLSYLRSQVTLVHQNPVLFDTTVEKNVEYGLKIRRVSRKKRALRVDQCLSIVGLKGFQKRKARELSGGEAQRVAIARALSIDPEVILLDEFSANIDNENRVIIENIIRDLNKQFKKTIIFTTHYIDQAYRLSDNVIHLFKGRIVTSQIKNIFRGIIKKTAKDNIFENGKIKLFISTAKQGNVTIAVPTNVITVSRVLLESSIRNRLKGKITHIIDNNKSVIVRVLSGEYFDAVITKKSYRNMGLEPGTEVYLNIKASSVEVF